MTQYLEDVFGGSGTLARAKENYEVRQGQIDLTFAIDEAIRDKTHLLAEGPTGSGKTFSYLVPVFHHVRAQRKRAVIVTANNSLQAQLMKKDIPTVTAAMDWGLTARALKGRGNFYCHDRAYDLRVTEKATASKRGDARAIAQLLAWAEKSPDGDRESFVLPPPPGAGRLWSRVAVATDECKGRGCESFDDCFANRHMASALGAQVIVTNYHYLFAHVAKMLRGEDRLLPAFDILIMDEAHEAVKIGRECLGFSVTEHRFQRLINYLHDGHLDDLSNSLLHARREFFDNVHCYWQATKRASRLQHPKFVNAETFLGVLGLVKDAALSRAAAPVSGPKGEHEAVVDRRAADLATKLVDQIDEFVLQRDPDKVYWIAPVEKGHFVTLEARLLDVASTLRGALFEQTPTVVMTSATLTTDGMGDFGFIRRQLGVLPETKEIVGESPFDLAHRTLLVVADRAVPPPRGAQREEHMKAVLPIYRNVIEACRGRTLCLFTARSDLNTVYEGIKDHGDYVYLKQEEGENRSLLQEAFRQDVSSVLLGVNSFWTGIDVPGEALIAVIIHKLPFPNPMDPIVSAIAERLGEKRYFEEFSTPLAAITFRQGIGRLIRSKTDYGLIVLLDNRFYWKMGTAFQRAVPRGVTAVTTDRILPRTFVDKAGKPIAHQSGAIEVFLRQFEEPGT